MASTRALPLRTTRGKRMRAVMEEEEDEADQEFWGQSFFAEEAADVDYTESSEEEDVVDSDFDEQARPRPARPCRARRRPPPCTPASHRRRRRSVARPLSPLPHRRRR